MNKPIMTLEELFMLSDKVKRGEKLSETEIENVRYTMERISEILKPLTDAIRGIIIEFYERLEAALKETKTGGAIAHKTILDSQGLQMNPLTGDLPHIVSRATKRVDL